jgi:hypothetical protein
MADDTPPPSSTGWVLNWALTGGTSLVVTLLAIVGNDVRGEVRDINFAWRVRWPKDKTMVIVPSG